ncbi:heterokaryon incompatibility protein [Colletotrichum truncatum]|uniref:Heterokaryon incompatibility protein n=1 Tax=Colletotrichum truncatum TaxID=5467 RepID=A0ACC3YYH9_COLTU
MAAQVLAHKEDRCISGVWESHTLLGLLWRCFGSVRLDRTGTQKIFFPLAKIATEVQAPSWSWASVEGPINYSLIRSVRNISFDAEIVVLDYPKLFNNTYWIMSPTCSLTLRGRVMDIAVEVPGQLLLRGSPIASHPHCSFLLNPPTIQSDLAIPKYDIFYQGHGPIQPHCDTCSLIHETVVFWPDTQLSPEQDRTGKYYLQKCIWPVERPKPAMIQTQCLLLYNRPGICWGGLMLQKSQQCEEAYERLGFVEFYSTHPLFEQLEELPYDVLKLL